MFKKAIYVPSFTLPYRYSHTGWRRSKTKFFSYQMHDGMKSIFLLLGSCNVCSCAHEIEYLTCRSNISEGKTCVCFVVVLLHVFKRVGGERNLNLCRDYQEPVRVSNAHLSLPRFVFRFSVPRLSKRLPHRQESVTSHNSPLG